MILSQTPLRVSLCSADYPSYYLEFGGAFIGFTISQYVYHSVRATPKYAGYHSRLVYSQIETVVDNQEIEHRAIKSTLEYLGHTNGLECIFQADINSKSGLGSSASFIVGLLNAVSSLRGTSLSPRQLADAAIFVECEKMGVISGVQDHIHASYGGINYCRLTTDNDSILSPIKLRCDEEAYLQSHLLLFHSGQERMASDIAKTFVGRKENIELHKNLTHLTTEIYNQVRNLNIEEVAKLVEQGWKLKRQLSSSVSNTVLDQIHDTAIANGALSVRVCGAGGGGVILIIAPPTTHPRLRSVFGNLAEIDFSIVHHGSRVILNNEDKKC